MNESNKEMSLFDFLRACWFYFWRLLRSIFIWTMRIVRLGLRYWYIIIICAVLGLIAGRVWCKKSFTRYYGDVTIRVSEGMKEPVKDAIYMFLAESGDAKVSYGLDPDVLRHMKWLRIYNVVDAKNDSTPDFVDRNYAVSQSDTFDIVMTDRLHIQICMRGMDDFSSFEAALRNYMHSQDKIMAADSVYKKIARERLDYFTHEVARVDSFCTFDYFEHQRTFDAKSRDALVLSERERNLYHADLMWLLANKNWAQQQVECARDVINFQSNIVLTVMPPVHKYVYGFAGGILLGFVVALIVKRRKEVMQFLKE